MLILGEDDAPQEEEKELTKAEWKELAAILQSLWKVACDKAAGK